MSNNFTYDIHVVNITGCSPSSGPTSVATAVVITGQGFASGAAVTFGGVSATSIVVVSDTEITCTTPATAAAGYVDIVITNTDSSTGTLSGGYRFVAGTPPLVVVITPKVGTFTGGVRLAPAISIKQSLGQRTTLTMVTTQEPKADAPVTVTVGGVLLFDGTVTKVTAQYDSDAVTSQSWEVEAVDRGWQLDRIFPNNFSWTNVAGNTVASQLFTSFGPGYTLHVVGGPFRLISIKVDGTAPFTQILTKVCGLCECNWVIVGTNVYMFQTNAGLTNPANITNANALLAGDGEPIRVAYDYTQIRNVVTVSNGSNLTVTVSDPASVNTYGTRDWKESDTNLGSIAECTLRAQNILANYAQPIPVISYSCRDLQTMAGKTVHANFTIPSISDDFLIRTVSIDQIDELLGTSPRFTVTAQPASIPMAAYHPFGAPGVTSLLQTMVGLTQQINQAPALTGDVVASPGGPTKIPAATVTNAQLAGCITTDQFAPGPAKDPVLAATSSNIVLSGHQTIEGIALVDGNRVLVRAQTNPAQNGIYVVSSGAWTLSTDTNTSTKLVAGITTVDQTTGVIYYLSSDLVHWLPASGSGSAGSPIIMMSLGDEIVESADMITIPVPGPQGPQGPAGSGGPAGSTAVQPIFFFDEIVEEGPTFLQNPSAPTPGSLVLVEEHTASSSSSLDFTTGITSTYDDYMFEIVNLVPASNAVDLQMLMSTNGGSTYDAGANYGSLMFFFTFNFSSANVGGVSGQNQITLYHSAGTTAHYSIGGVGRIFNPGSADYKNVMFDAVGMSSDGNPYRNNVLGVYIITTAVNAFRIKFNSGNIASGNIRLYGVAK